MLAVITCCACALSTRAPVARQATIRMSTAPSTSGAETAPATPKPAPTPPPAMPSMATYRGNGARPRGEWPTDAGFGKHAGMPQAAFSMALPPKVSIELPIGEEPQSLEFDIPSFSRPQLLDGTHAGDFGFDPLGLATDVPTLHKYLEAEVKHARLAMLAVAGWAGAELFAEGGLAAGGRAPSLLNGHLLTSLPNLVGTALVFALIGVMENTRDSTTSDALPADDGSCTMTQWVHYLDGPYVPGCYEFDPLGARARAERRRPSPPPCGGAPTAAAAVRLGEQTVRGWVARSVIRPHACIPNPSRRSYCRRPVGAHSPPAAPVRTRRAPAGLYGLLGTTAAGRRSMRELEVQHGRVAMLAITWWALAEPLTHTAITSSNAIFFKPTPVVIWDFVQGLVKH